MPSSTLADLLTPLLVANPFLAMRATLLWWLGDKFEYGLPHGWQSWLRRWTVDFFFPSRCFEPAILKEGVGDHCHERMPMQALPESALKYRDRVLLSLLTSLLANPSRLDGAAKVRRSASAGRLAR